MLIWQNQGDTSQAFDAQVDTLILDHRKDLNAIIDSILQACVQKVDDAMYELEAPMQTGNTTATPEYTLSMIEKAMTNATEFASTFNLYLGKKTGGGFVDVIKTANDFAQALSETLVSAKGITRFAETDEASERMVRVAKGSGDAGQRFFLNLQSFRLLAGGKNEDVALRSNAEARATLAKLSEAVEKLVPKSKAKPTRQWRYWRCGLPGDAERRSSDRGSNSTIADPHGSREGPQIQRPGCASPRCHS